MLRLKKSIFPHKTASLYHLPARTYELQALTCSVQARTQELTSLVFTRFCLESSSTWLWNLAPVTGQVKSPSLATVNLEFTNGGPCGPWCCPCQLPQGLHQELPNCVHYILSKCQKLMTSAKLLSWYRRFMGNRQYILYIMIDFTPFLIFIFWNQFLLPNTMCVRIPLDSVIVTWSQLNVTSM